MPVHVVNSSRAWRSNWILAREKVTNFETASAEAAVRFEGELVRFTKVIRLKLATYGFSQKFGNSSAYGA